MGVYLRVPERSLRQEKWGKATFLVMKHGAEILTEPLRPSAAPPGKAVVCVVRNPSFEAAGWAYNDREFERFVRGMADRPATWLLMDESEVEELSGATRRELDEDELERGRYG